MMATTTATPMKSIQHLFFTLLVCSTLLLNVAHGFHQPTRKFGMKRHSSGALILPPGSSRSFATSTSPLSMVRYDDDDDDDDDDAPDVDIRNFTPPPSYSMMRSAPNQRKAMSTKASSQASVHVCTNCAAEFVKWMGRCPTCREWNTLQEFKVNRSKTSLAPRPSFGGGSSSGSSSSSSNSGSWLGGGGGGVDFANAPIRVTDVYKKVKKDKQGNVDDYQGRPTRLMVPGDDELNTVMGGGIMTGSLTLIGGDPGVGKSTLMLQTAGAIASLSAPSVGIGMGPVGGSSSTPQQQQRGPVWYISGEENAQQIASRAMRLGIDESELWLLTETHVDTLCEQVVASYHTPTSVASVQRGADDDDFGDDDAVIPGQKPKPPSLLVIDSIQTMICESGGSSAAGGVTQVRECVALFLRLAKSTGIPIVLVGHVTKNGDVAGPRTVEHMVDCVLYLEGGDYRTVGGVNLRMLRAAKNRFGSADEVGVYEMTTGRLMPVSDPSSLFLSGRMDTEDSEGCAISLILEGLRAMTVEVQALVTPNMEGHGRRTVNGFPYPRVQLLLGVLQKRCGMFFGKQDVYVNVVGNMNIDSKNEGSGSDLAVSISLVSSLLRIPVRSDTAFIGEIGLLGELRPVPAVEKRLQEARRMGFSRVVSSRSFQRNQKSYQRGKPSFSRIDGMDWIQCDTLVEALNEGLVTRLPKRGKRKAKKSDEGNPPGTIEDLMLQNSIIVDEEEEDDSVFD